MYRQNPVWKSGLWWTWECSVAQRQGEIQVFLDAFGQRFATSKPSLEWLTSFQRVYKEAHDAWMCQVNRPVFYMALSLGRVTVPCRAPIEAFPRNSLPNHRVFTRMGLVVRISPLQPMCERNCSKGRPHEPRFWSITPDSLVIFILMAKPHFYLTFSL